MKRKKLFQNSLLKIKCKYIDTHTVLDKKYHTTYLPHRTLERGVTLARRFAMENKI